MLASVRHDILFALHQNNLDNLGGNRLESVSWPKLLRKCLRNLKKCNLRYRRSTKSACHERRDFSDAAANQDAPCELLAAGAALQLGVDPDDFWGRVYDLLQTTD